MKAQDPAAIVPSWRRRSAVSDRRDGAEGCLHRPRAAGYGPNRAAVSPRPGPGDYGEAAGREGDDRGGEPVPGGVAAARHPARCGGAPPGDRSASAEASGSCVRPHPVSHDHPGSAQGLHPHAAGGRDQIHNHLRATHVQVEDRIDGTRRSTYYGRGLDDHVSTARPVKEAKVITAPPGAWSRRHLRTRGAQAGGRRKSHRPRGCCHKPDMSIVGGHFIHPILDICPRSA